MLLKGLHKWISSIALLAVIVSLSGFTDYQSYPQKPQTELVISNTSINPVKARAFKFLKHSNHSVTFNQYTTFCFKWFLHAQKYSLNVTFKSQKENVLQFNKHLFLEQNLIAQIFSSNSPSHFIK